MSDERLLSQIRNLRFTADLPESVVAELAGYAIEEDVASGTRIFREGSDFEKMFVIISGRVLLDMHVPSRGNVTMLSLGPGDMVGWSAVVSDTAMTASATAAADTHLLSFDGPALRELCERNHEFGHRFYRQMASALSRRLVATRLQLLDLFGDDAASIDPDAGRAEPSARDATMSAGNRE